MRLLNNFEVFPESIKSENVEVMFWIGGLF